MSKLFYDHLIILGDVEAHIKGIVETEEERHELWQIVDEIIHHRMLEFLLDQLDHKHHDEFLNRFHECPHDHEHINYLNEKIEGDVEDLIRNEISKLTLEIIKKTGSA